MACPRCSNENSGQFNVTNIRYAGDTVTYVCEHCNQRWWCYNTHYRLWSMIDDDFTWDNILNGCPLPVAIGYTSVTPRSIIPKNYAKPINICNEKVHWAKLIVKPTDKETLSKLEAKLKEYEKRTKQHWKGWEWILSARLKAYVLRAVLDKNMVGYDYLEKLAYGEFVNRKKVVAATFIEDFPKAWMTIWGYINGPENVTGGTGLKS